MSPILLVAVFQYHYNLCWQAGGSDSPGTIRAAALSLLTRPGECNWVCSLGCGGRERQTVSPHGDMILRGERFPANTPGREKTRVSYNADESCPSPMPSPRSAIHLQSPQWDAQARCGLRGAPCTGFVGGKEPTFTTAKASSPVLLPALGRKAHVHP